MVENNAFYGFPNKGPYEQYTDDAIYCMKFLKGTNWATGAYTVLKAYESFIRPVH